MVVLQLLCDCWRAKSNLVRSGISKIPWALPDKETSEMGKLPKRHINLGICLKIRYRE